MTTTTHAPLGALADGEHLDAAEVRDRYFATIRHAIAHQPRTLQTALGPSELGQKCARRLGYKMLGRAEVNTRRVPWLPFIGTAVHAMLDDIFTAANAGRPVEWLTEGTVDVGELVVQGQTVPITGHSDLLAFAGRTVIDHKIVGVSTLRSAKRDGPSQQYRSQAQLYGRGFTRRGLPVEHVAIAYLPRGGDLEDAVWWSEPYDEQAALAALARAQQVQTLADALGATALDVLTASEDYCATCPFYWPGSTDLTRGCPGVKPTAPTPAPAGSVFT